ncbi:MAG: hypothetical protein ACKO5K_13490 [Armatimonadota bacterium]
MSTARTERWQTLLIHPVDLLKLLRFAADGEPVAVPELPPDTVARDGGFDTERGCFVVVLESAFFEPTRVEDDGQSVAGDWEELLLSLGDGEAIAPAPLPPPPDPGPQAQWEGWLFSPADLLELLRRLSTGEPVGLDPIPPDAHVVDAFYNPERNRCTLVLGSALFSRTLARRIGEVTHLKLPEHDAGLAG